MWILVTPFILFERVVLWWLGPNDEIQWPDE